MLDDDCDCDELNDFDELDNDLLLDDFEIDFDDFELDFDLRMDLGGGMLLCLNPQQKYCGKMIQQRQRSTPTIHQQITDQQQQFKLTAKLPRKPVQQIHYLESNSPACSN